MGHRENPNSQAQAIHKLLMGLFSSLANTETLLYPGKKLEIFSFLKN
jgi:hypothetical protein